MLYLELVRMTTRGQVRSCWDLAK